MTLIKALHQISPKSEEPVAIVHQGLTHKETIIHSLVEIFYAFVFTDPNLMNQMTKYLVELLLDADAVISHSAKQAIIRLLRPKYKRARKVLIESTTPPGCQTPIPAVNVVSSTTNDLNVTGVTPIQEVDAIEPLGLEPGDEEGASGNAAASAIEALFGIARIPPLMDLGQEVDDEALMEFAIALSLQENEGDLQALQGLGNWQDRIRGNRAFAAIAAAAGIDLGNNNNDDEDASNVGQQEAGAGSDDEDEAASNAATDGSNLRSSPTIEQIDFGNDNANDGGDRSNGGSDSGGSTYDDPLIPSTSNQSPPATVNYFYILMTFKFNLFFFFLNFRAKLLTIYHIRANKKKIKTK